jgi:general secretion pathway protein B
MSTILDALRRAEAERARGTVPGVHSPNLAGPLLASRPQGDERAAPSSPGARLRVVLLSVAGVLVAIGAGWWLGRAQAPGLAPQTADAASVVSPAPGATPGAMPGATPIAQTSGSPWPAPATANAQPAVPTIVVVPMPTPAPAPAPAGPAPGAAAPAPLPTAVPPGPVPAASLAASPAASPAAAPPAPAMPSPPPQAPSPTVEPAIPLDRLTQAQRAALPPMAVGGSVWSEQPGSRFVLINGQVVREGDVAAPGVVLERIGPRAAVLRWQGLRVEIPL